MTRLDFDGVCVNPCEDGWLNGLLDDPNECFGKEPKFVNGFG